MLRPQSEFPLMKEYKAKFAITEYTIFALYPDVYANSELPDHLWVHENTHLKQQEKIGVQEWVRQFLEEPQSRLRFEIEAYQTQLRSIKDRNFRDIVRRESAKNLSSALYGNIINYESAFKLLKI